MFDLNLILDGGQPSTCQTTGTIAERIAFGVGLEAIPPNAL